MKQILVRVCPKTFWRDLLASTLGDRLSGFPRESPKVVAESFRQKAKAPILGRARVRACPKTYVLQNFVGNFVANFVETAQFDKVPDKERKE